MSGPPEGIIRHCAEYTFDVCGEECEICDRRIRDARDALSALGSLPAEQRAEIVEAVSWDETLDHGRLGYDIAAVAVDAVLSFLSGTET